MDIERIEDWVGQEVVDSDGEKLGKLEDVLFGAGSRDAVAATVKSGLLGRRHYLVPLQGATATRASVRVPFSKDQLKDAPQVEPGADVRNAERDAAAQHFGLDLSGCGQLESGAARASRQAEAEEAKQKAFELEGVAERKAAEAREQELAATASREAAERAERDREAALSEAAEKQGAADSGPDAP